MNLTDNETWTPPATLETLRRLPGVKGTPETFTAQCPAHEDHENSLSVSMADTGRVLVHCHAGCATRDVVEAVGLSMRDLFPSNGHARKGEIVATYQYTDADGALLFQVCRFNPKRFLQRRPDGAGGWLWNLRGISRPLYHLPEVNAARAEGRTVFLCEGEKDADNVRALGLCATTNAGGAAKWTAADVDTLKGADVVVLADNDGPGLSGAWKRADSIPGAVVLLLPGLPEKGDVSDWLAAGGTREELERLAREVRETPPTRPAEDTERPEATPGKSDPLSELRNAERLVAHKGADFRHHQVMSWLHWDGRRWARDVKAAQLAASTVGNIIREEAKSLIDPEAARAFFSAARRAESGRGIDSTLKIAAALPPVNGDAIDWDSHLWLLNVRNGTLDLRDGTLHPHQREHYITALAPVEYDAAAQCPAWDAHIKKLFDGNEELEAVLQYAFGYALTGDTTHQVAFIFYGSKGCGKSSTLAIWRHILGPDYFKAIDNEVLLQQKFAQHSCDLAALAGARMILAQEFDDCRQLNSPRLKALTGGDPISAREIRGMPFTFDPQFKLFIGTNPRPPVNDGSGALFRRLCMVPFEHYMCGDDRNLRINDEFKRERAGILAWAVRGAMRAAQGKPKFPAIVQQSVESYENENDLHAQFAAECCEEWQHGTLPKGKAYRAYHLWSNGRCEGRRAFIERFNRRGYGEKKTEHGHCWAGISLNAEWQNRGG